MTSQHEGCRAKIQVTKSGKTHNHLDSVLPNQYYMAYEISHSGHSAQWIFVGLVPRRGRGVQARTC
jgi:hypothetical protein